MIWTRKFYGDIALVAVIVPYNNNVNRCSFYLISTASLYENYDPVNLIFSMEYKISYVCIMSPVSGAHEQNTKRNGKRNARGDTERQETKKYNEVGRSNSVNGQEIDLKLSECAHCM